MKKLLLFSLIFAFYFPIEMNAQSARVLKKRKNKKQNNKEVSIPKPKKSKIPKYSDFVNKHTKTDDGLFKVHETK